MRTAGIILAVAGALTLVVGCGDDDNKTKVYLDHGVAKYDTGGQFDTGGGQYDTGGGQFDTGGGKLDGQGPMTNSGAICNQTTPCASSTEGCLGFSSTATNGMCLGKCNASGTDCPVADSTKQLSKCILQDTQKQLYCGWICEVGGQTYDCPDSTSYDCKSVDPNQPTTKLCIPK